MATQQRPPTDPDERWRILRLHVEDRVPLAELERSTGVSVRTLSRWKAAFARGGLAGLARQPRADRAGRRIDPRLVRLIEDLGLTRPRASVATIHRAAVRSADGLGCPAPSYRTESNIVNALDPALVTLALDGPTSYRDKYELVLRRQADRPNAMWQCDHTELDILILGTNGKAIRPWLTIVQDDHSRAICGYTVFVGAPSAMNTALALRQAIWHKQDPQWAMCGIPDVLYVDHGTDFTSSHISQAAIDLHIRVIHSTVARPQGRGKIERFYRTINTELLPTLPGHLAPQQRRPDPALTLSQLDHAIGQFITTYNHREHRETGTSPHRAWVADGWLPRMPENLDALDGLLLHVARPRTVQRDGIHFQGLRYLAPTLATYVGTTVTIRYDPRHITEIRVFDHDTFICTAINEQHVGETISLKDVQAARNARRRKLRARLKERILTSTATSTPAAPAIPSRSEPAGPEPLVRPRKPKLRTYVEDD